MYTEKIVFINQLYIEMTEVAEEERKNSPNSPYNENVLKYIFSPPPPPAFRPNPPASRPHPPAFRPNPPAFRPTPPAFRPNPPASRPNPSAFWPNPPAFRPTQAILGLRFDQAYTFRKLTSRCTIALGLKYTFRPCQACSGRARPF